MIDNLLIIKWNDWNYELQSSHLHIFGSKCYVITNIEYKKQLQDRTEIDPCDFMGITVSEKELATHVDYIF